LRQHVGIGTAVMIPAVPAAGPRAAHTAKYFINNSSYYLQVPNVFAGLVTIALIGILVEWLFTLVERRTIIRWGMKVS
jgi:ABC-type nitrate/sulfonate/bicarbonate transport system permease component